MKLLSLVSMLVVILGCSAPIMDIHIPVSKLKTVKKGNMYYTGYGKYEHRKRIVLIDRSIGKRFLNHPSMCRDFAEITEKKYNRPINGHGIKMSSIIIRNMDRSQYCLTSARVIYSEYYLNGLLKELKSLTNLHSINASFTLKKYSHETYLYIVKLLKKGANINIAAGNEGFNLDDACIIYPACYSKLIKDDYPKLRSNIKVIGGLGGVSNYGSIVDVFLDARVSEYLFQYGGSSSATAIYTGITAN